MPGWADAPGRVRHRAASPACVRTITRAIASGSIPTSPGRRSPGRGWETVVRFLIERDGRRLLRPLDERCPERTVDVGNETHIRGVVVFVGKTV